MILAAALKSKQRYSELHLKPMQQQTITRVSRHNALKIQPINDTQNKCTQRTSIIIFDTHPSDNKYTFPSQPNQIHAKAKGKSTPHPSHLLSSNLTSSNPYKLHLKRSKDRNGHRNNGPEASHDLRSSTGEGHNGSSAVRRGAGRGRSGVGRGGRGRARGGHGGVHCGGGGGVGRCWRGRGGGCWRGGGAG